MLKIPFGKLIKNQNNQRKNGKTLPTLRVEFHDLQTFPGANEHKKSHEAKIELRLLQRRENVVEEFGAQWRGAQYNDSAVNNAGKYSLQ